MLKSAVVLIVLSVVVMFFQSELNYVLHYLLKVHNSVARMLVMVFSNTALGRLIQETLALIIIPVILSAIVALIWFMIRRNEMPHFIGTVWIIWTILLVALLSQPTVNKRATVKKTAQIHRAVYY